MVKASPKIQNNLLRRRKKFMDLRNNKLLRETLFLHFNPKSLTTQNSVSVSVSPSSGHHLQLQQQQTNGSLLTNSNSKVHESPLSSNKKRRSRSPISTYATCSSSSPPVSPSLSPSFVDPKSSQQTQFLRRTVSGPPFFFSDSSAEDSSSSKKMRKNNKQELNQSSPICRNLMGRLLPPLPPHPSPKLLRRTVSDPVPLLTQNNSTSKEKNKREAKKEQIVKAERLSSDWTMIKLKCGCGSNVKFLFCPADNKCYKLV